MGDMKWFEVIGLVGAIIAIGQLVAAINRWLRKDPAPQAAAGSPRDKRIGIALAVVCAFIWSISYSSLSIAQRTADPYSTNTVMLGVAALLLIVAGHFAAPLARLISNKGDPAAKEERAVDASSLLFWVIVAGNVGSFLLFVYALMFISASQTIALQKVNPIFVAVLGAVFLRQRLSMGAWLSVLLTVLGALLVTTNVVHGEIAFGSAADQQGSLLALGAGVTFAAFSVAFERLGRLSQSAQLKTLGIVFAASYVTILTWAYFSGVPFVFDANATPIALANGVRVAVVYFIFIAAVERIGSLLTSVIVSLEVVLTVLWDKIFLSTSPTLGLCIGAVIILAGGMALTISGNSYRTDEAR